MRICDDGMHSLKEEPTRAMMRYVRKELYSHFDLHSDDEVGWSKCGYISGEDCGASETSVGFQETCGERGYGT